MLYALVASDCGFAVDLFVDRRAAERVLGDVIADEPSFADLVSVVELPQQESQVAAWIRVQAATS